MHQHNLLVYLKFISHFDIAQKVPVHGEITFAELAASLGINQGAVTRILRLAIAYRIFCEPRTGVIAHSAASRQIADDPRVASWVGAGVDEMWPAAEKVVDALKKWPQAAEPNQTVSGYSSIRARLLTTIRAFPWRTILTSHSMRCSLKILAEHAVLVVP